MPKKLCCCDDRRPVPVIPHWVAIPCVEYISELYDDVGEQRIWNNVPAVTHWESGITYPFAFVDTPDFIAFDYGRQVYGMMRGGGGGGKTGDSISEPVKGGNAAYGEKIFAPTTLRSFYVGPGGSGPEALDIHIVSSADYSGAQGYPKAAWGGALSGFGQPLEIQDRVAGGGGGGTKNYTQGGHGGVTQGVSGGSNILEDAYGGWGADNLKGGTSGQIGFGFPATNPQNGGFGVGGRGQVLLNTNPIVPFDYAGGGGAAGYLGGGGGASGGGGGGGLSVVLNGTEYQFPGTDIGPGSRCNPYFQFNTDYGLGAQRFGRSIEQCEVWEGCPNNVETFRSGTTGIQGAAATYFRNKWCTCTETQSEGKIVPVPNYICLTQEQYLAIVDQQPTATAPPGSDVKLSFVLNDIRYVLVYKCDIGCESKYLVAGTPTDVKWYVKNLSPAWFADFPNWSPDDVTSCCDCYDCQPLCKGPEAPVDSPTPSNVRSCDIITGATCYLHLDNANSKWYYKCRKSNCWADFGLESITKPYILRSMDPNTNFDCGDDPCEEQSITWIANRCDLITQKECCETSQCCGPAQIKFCDVYLRKLLTAYPGTYPIDLNQYCYYFSYVGCIYVLANFVTTPPCVPSDSTPENPINQGQLFAITDKSNLDCCREGLFAGGTDPGAVKPPPEPLPCEAVIVECFPFKDQFGVVQDVKVSSPMSACGLQAGTEWNIICKDPDAVPNTYPNVNPDYVQKVGLCYEARPRPTTGQYTLSADSHTEHIYVNEEYYECPDCPTNVVCRCDCIGPCQQGGPGGIAVYNPDCCPPCDEPQYCSQYAIAESSYTLTTKYKVGVAGKFAVNFPGQDPFYRADAFKLKFSLCEAQNAGIDLDNPEELFDFYSSKVQITSNVAKQFTLPWEPMYNCTVGVGGYETPQPAMCIRICDYQVKTYSGNAGHICEKINERLNGIVQATGINPYFWFGWRVGCTQCTQTPNEPQPRFLGDDIETDRGVKDLGDFSYTLFFAGVSQRWYVVACQELVPTTKPDGFVRNMSASVNSLSQAEYAQGLLYTMKNVQSDSTIINPIGQCSPVQECTSDGDYPLTDVILSGAGLVFYGYISLSGNMGCVQPRRNCKQYELKYDVVSCEDADNGITNELCIGCDNGVVYPFGCNVKEDLVCSTQGGTITIS